MCSAARIVGVATDTMVVSTRIMKKPTHSAHSAGQGLRSPVSSTMPVRLRCGTDKNGLARASGSRPERPGTTTPEGPAAVGDPAGRSGGGRMPGCTAPPAAAAASGGPRRRAAAPALRWRHRRRGAGTSAGMPVRAQQRRCGAAPAFGHRRPRHGGTRRCRGGTRRCRGGTGVAVLEQAPGRRCGHCNAGADTGLPVRRQPTWHGRGRDRPGTD